MRPIPPNILRLARQHAPAFVDAVRTAKAARQDSQPVIAVSLCDFPDGDMALVYACLWYAASEQVAVLFGVPDEMSGTEPAAP